MDRSIQAVLQDSQHSQILQCVKYFLISTCLATLMWVAQLETSIILI